LAENKHTNYNPCIGGYKSMTENAETYILHFGGTILKEYNGVYLV